MNHHHQMLCLVLCVCNPGVHAGGSGRPEDQGGGPVVPHGTSAGDAAVVSDLERCRALLRSAKQSGEEWLAYDQAHILIRRLRKQRDADCAAFLRSVATNTTVPEYVRAEAVGSLYHVTGNVHEAMAWATSDNDRMRGAAIEALAPDLLGDPEFDTMIEALTPRGQGEERTCTNSAIRRIIWIKWFRKEFAAKPDAESQIGLVLGVLDMLCPERPASWCVGTDAIAQDVLRKLRDVDRKAPKALRAALEKKAAEDPRVAPLVALVLEELGRDAAARVPELERE